MSFIKEGFLFIFSTFTVHIYANKEIFFYDMMSVRVCKCI